MKNLKKLASIALAAILVLAMMVPVLAVEGDGFKITVSNPQPGSTYEFYKLFDVTAEGEGEDAKYSYTATGKWEAFFEATGADFLTDNINDYLVSVAGQDKYLNIVKEVAGEGETTEIVVDDAKVADFANAARLYALNASVEADTSIKAEGAALDDNGALTASFPSAGYFMVFAKDATQKTSNASMCILTNTNSDQTIKIKSEKPSIEKSAGTEDAPLAETSAQVGDVVPFVITGEVPNTEGFETFTYTITDTMSTGLTYNEDAQVKIGGAVATENVTVTKTGDGFTVAIDVTKFTAGDKIVVTYSATINEEAAKTYDPETNTATLTYSDPNSDDGETTTKPGSTEVPVYVSTIVIDKFEGDPENIEEKPENATQLAGAEFALYKEVTEDETTTKLYYKYVEADAETGDKARVDWVADVANATTVITDADGKAEFAGLANGTYFLEEIEAPDGYNKLTQAKKVTVNPTRTAIDSETKATLESDEDIAAAEAVGKLAWVYDANITSEVANLSGSVLPETGGIGTTIFYIVGGLLVVGAGILLVVRKRMNREEG